MHRTPEKDGSPKGEAGCHHNRFDRPRSPEHEEFLDLVGIPMSPSSSPLPGKGYDLDAEFERLQQSIDGLTGAVSGLHADMSRQAEKIEQATLRQTSDFRELLTRLHDNYKSLVDFQRDAFGGFADRLDRLLAKQEEQAAAIRAEMRTDFARMVDRQDSHFRWLMGLVVVSAVSLAIAIFRAH